MTQQSSPQHQLDVEPLKKTLLEGLAEIDDAHAHGAATPEQERRGAEIVELCNSAEQMKAEIECLTKDLSSQRSYTKHIEKEAQKQRRQFWAYKTIDDVYKSLKRDAESDAQGPFDEHFRECLYGLQAIAADSEACTCKSRGWHGEGHDSQCPIRIADEACERASIALGEGLKARNPLLHDGERRRSMTHPEFTNTDRAKRAQKALKRYNGDNDAIANAIDFLTDLQHFYNIEHAKDISHPSFDDALESARGHFEAEQNDVSWKGGEV